MIAEVDVDASRPLKSLFPGVVSDDAWTRFVRAMMTQTVAQVSESNALGMFEMTPRRLCDLGLVGKLKRGKSKAGKTIWTGTFRPPLSAARFLSSPTIQYRAFCASMKDYFDGLCTGRIEACDQAMSSAGSLAILHRAGPRALVAWAGGRRFSATVSLYEKADGIF